MSSTKFIRAGGISINTREMRSTCGSMTDFQQVAANLREIAVREKANINGDTLEEQWNQAITVVQIEKLADLFNDIDGGENTSSEE